MMLKKGVIILVIIAIILAAVSITYRLIYSEKSESVSTTKTGEGNLKDTGQGGLGITINPSPAENKNGEG